MSESDPRFREAWRRVGAEMEAFREEVRELPVVPATTSTELRAALASGFDLEDPSDVDDAVAHVIDLLRKGTVHVTSPRYFGLFNPTPLEAGILGDVLAALYNLQLAARSHAPAATEMERLALARLAETLGFGPDEIHANFTSGGAEANLSAVLAALAHRHPAWASEGNAALPDRPAIYLSEEAHHSFAKVVRMTGLGLDALREVPVTEALSMDPDALERRMRRDVGQGRHPLMVVATAGTTSAGTVDPLEEVAAVAGSFGAWFHVDAAWGGAAALSPRLRPALRGIERADSVTWDAHKWLSVPMGLRSWRRPVSGPRRVNRRPAPPPG